MQEYQRRFLQSALARDALRFGDFTLKSGRSSPYFFNAGRFDSGAALADLGEGYAQTVLAAGMYSACVTFTPIGPRKRTANGSL